MSDASTMRAALTVGLCFILLAGSSARADEAEPGALNEPPIEAVDDGDDEFVAPEVFAPSPQPMARVPEPAGLPRAQPPGVGSPTEPPRDEAPETREDLRFEVRFGVSVPERGGYDAMLDAHGYGSVQLAPAGAVALSGRVFDWLWLGGRFGLRGRNYGHRYLDSVSLGAGDLLATLTARFELGPLVELGIELAGGVGYLGIHHREQISDQILPRFDAAALFGVKAGRHLVIGLRVGYSLFRWEGASRFDEMVDLGGPFFALAFEGRP